MIQQLYIFSGGSYVVAEDWNANFGALKTSNDNCETAITDANNALAFPDSDLTSLYTALKSQLNSFRIPGTSIVISPECEYTKALNETQELYITVPENFNSEARIVFSTPNTRNFIPFHFNYEGTVNYLDDITSWQNPGMKFVFLYETNGNLYVKLITGA